MNFGHKNRRGFYNFNNKNYGDLDFFIKNLCISIIFTIFASLFQTNVLWNGFLGVSYMTSC